MKRLLILGIACLGFSASQASAATLDLDQSAGGAAAVFTPTTLVPGAVALSFTPSAQVVMDGKSVRTSFAINAYHGAVLNKASGQAYGMAADSKKVYFLDISTVTAYASPTGTTAATFSGANPAWTSL